MGNYTTSDKNLIKVIDTIKHKVLLHSIYLIGFSKKSISRESLLAPNSEENKKCEFTYSLLVISHDFIANPKTFMNDVFNRTVEKCEVFSIHYTLNDVRHRLIEGDNFLSLILSESQMIYQKNDELQYLPKTQLYHPEIFQEIKTQWELRFKRAMYFEEKLEVGEMITDVNARYLILQETIRQVCLGLLYLFWEFKPSYFSLFYLLHFCHQFTTIPEIIYPKRSFRSKRIYNNFCNARYNLNNKTEVDQEIHDVNKAHQLSYKFLKEANKLATKKLTELEVLHSRNKIHKKL